MEVLRRIRAGREGGAVVWKTLRITILFRWGNGERRDFFDWDYEDLGGLRGFDFVSGCKSLVVWELCDWIKYLLFLLFNA
jgi:hypothetical protein